MNLRYSPTLLVPINIGVGLGIQWLSARMQKITSKNQP